jgi:hypothetical protein
MKRADGTLPAAQFVAALLAGRTAEQAYSLSYQTPELHSDNKGSSEKHS